MTHAGTDFHTLKFDARKNVPATLASVVYNFSEHP